MKPLLPALAAALALTVWGCDRADPKPASQGPVSVSPERASLPYIFSLNSADAEVSLRIDRRAGAWPALHQHLYGEGRRELTDFAGRAALDRRAARADGLEPAAYTRKVVWAVVAETDRLVSLRQDWDDYTGAAHPNHGTVALLWSKGGEAPLLQSALFRPDADYAALDRMLCEAVLRARRERVGEAAAPPGGACPEWRDSRAVLVPSTVPGRAGGLMFLFDPYVLGAYAEGSYEVVIPQARIRAALAPAHAGEFDGAPRPAAQGG